MPALSRGSFCSSDNKYSACSQSMLLPRKLFYPIVKGDDKTANAGAVWGPLEYEHNNDRIIQHCITQSGLTRPASRKSDSSTSAVCFFCFYLSVSLGVGLGFYFLILVRRMVGSKYRIRRNQFCAHRCMFSRDQNNEKWKVDQITKKGACSRIHKSLFLITQIYDITDLVLLLLLLSFCLVFEKCTCNA
jgi:hypothetical protein